MKRYASFGSVSSGTMRPEDLIDSFTWELRMLAKRGRRVREFAGLLRDADRVDPESDDASDIVSELFDALEEFAPPYAYFGAHPCDGADYGFWLGEEFPGDCFDGLQVSDTSEIPRDYYGEVLHVNERGNRTLYVRYRNNRLSEIWGVV